VSTPGPLLSAAKVVRNCLVRPLTAEVSDIVNVWLVLPVVVGVTVWRS
jgi:hypothetical protein